MDPAPDYVHRILDSYTTGARLDLTDAEVPPDVAERLGPKLTGWHAPDEYGGRPSIRLRPDLELPAKGWVRPGDPPVECDACDRLVHYWELHHLDPKGWGGDPSQLLVDRQIVWVRIDGDCHSTAHMILDTAKAQGQWPELWLNGYNPPIPHAIVEIARRGWNLSQKRLLQAPAEMT